MNATIGIDVDGIKLLIFIVKVEIKSYFSTIT